MRETKSTCCYCGVGCGVIIEHYDDEITGVRGDPEHPANFGKLCSKEVVCISVRKEFCNNRHG